ncbi:hypothetical protein [Mesobacillus foraminis]|nr:hypothetical protein [Mesobacillus foraminis]MBT2754985.1 hypothetical protein [Mesobacillus foraminis]
MYRFSMDGTNWIIRFSPHLQIDDDDKEIIIKSLTELGGKVAGHSHGDSFLFFDQKMGVVVFRIEKVPSFILTVSTIVPKDQWFVRNHSGIEPYKE